MDNLIQDNLLILKKEFNRGTSADLEKLSALILEKALGITVRIASSGSQLGADAGVYTTTRAIRVEAKRYKESTSLSKHELMGKVAEAFQDNPYLEAWILVTTKIAPELSVKDLTKYGIDHGIPIFILDWAGEVPLLAMLCAAIPNEVGTIYGGKAQKAAEILASQCQDNNALKNLKSEVENWSVGWAITSRQSNQSTSKIFKIKTESLSLFKQDLSIENESSGYVKRKEILLEFNKALSSTEENSPIVILGKEGRGKSWVLADWVLSQLENEKVILYCSALEFKSLKSLKVEDVLAYALYRRTGSLDIDYWKKRISHLNQNINGDVLIWLVIDGLNETHSVEWTEFLLDSQRDIWHSKVKVIVSCRTQYFEDTLREGKSWVYQPITINVPIFTDVERNQALKLQNVKSNQLSDSVLKLASIPRICRLVSIMASELEGIEDITYERLLFAYGKRFDPDARQGLSDKIWLAFLRGLATQMKSDLTEFKQEKLKSWIDFQKEEIVTSSLSDIIDGLLVKDDGCGLIEFDMNLVLVANGLALSKKIQSKLKDKDTNICHLISKEMEPLGGIDERSKIIWSALAATITSSLSEDNIQIIVSALLVEGLASQNMNEDDERSLLSYTKNAPSGYLTAIAMVERSNRHQDANILTWALLKSVNDENVQNSIIEFSTDWIRLVELNLANEKDRPKEQRYRTNLFIRWLGCIPNSGFFKVLSEEIIIEEEGETHRLPLFALRLMQACPLSKSALFWRRFGVAKLFDNYNLMSDYASWIVKFNRVDYLETVNLLHSESDKLKKEQVLIGSDNNLAKRAAANLLWPIGDDDSYVKARELVPVPDGWESLKAYENEKSSFDSIFGIKNNYFEKVLDECKQPVIHLIERANLVWPDPIKNVPDTFVFKLDQYKNEFEFGDVDTCMGQSRGDIDHRYALPAFAKSSSNLLASFKRNTLRELKKRTGEKWARLATYNIIDLWLIVDKEDCKFIEAELLRKDIGDCGEGNTLNLARLSLNVLSSRYKSPIEYAKDLINQGVKSFTNEGTNSFKALSVAESDSLLQVLGQNDSCKEWVFVNILAHTDTAISVKVADYLISLCSSNHLGLRRLVLYVLSLTNNKYIAKKFLESGWSAKNIVDDTERLHGSIILLSALTESNLSDILPRIHPAQLFALAFICTNIVEKKIIAKTITELLPLGGNIPQHAFDEIVEINPNTFHESYKTIQLEEVNNSLQLSELQDIDSYFEKTEKAKQAALEIIESNRGQNLPFYSTWINPKHISDIVEKVPKFLDYLLKGLEEKTSDIETKIQHALGLYISLCRYLLNSNPQKGAKLWRLIDELTIQTHFVNNLGLDKLILVVFEAKDNEHVLKLKNEIWDISKTNSDYDVFRLILTACSTNSNEWLDKKIKEDFESSRPWQNRRALIVSSLRISPSFNRDDFNLGNDLYPPTKILEIETSKFASRAIWQRHWLNKYLTDKSNEDAYASFILFKEVADRRWLFILEELQKEGVIMTEERKCYLNMMSREIDKTVKKFDEKLKETFLLKKKKDDLWPWFNYEV